jgi:hypothetical protein
MSDPKLTELFEAYKDQREVAEAAGAVAKKESKALKAIEGKMVDHMLENNVKGIKTDDGCNLYLKRHLSLSSTEENRERIREWLIAQTGDDEPYMETGVKKSALKELVEQRIEDGKIESDFPAFLKVSLHPAVGLLGWKERMQAKKERSE